MEKLQDRWKNLILIEVEDEEVNINEQLLAKEVKKEELSIVEKLLVERIVNKEVLRSTMAKVWKTTKSFTVVEIKPNLFIFSFV